MINKFKEEYFFLSNFFMHPVGNSEGEIYPSVEHAYQAAKTIDSQEKASIKNAVTAGAAKRIGKNVTLRADWEEIKIDVMRQLVFEKFFFDRQLCDMLLDTGDQPLVEGNNWGDVFWGQVKGVGENWLGKILMECRDSLREKKKYQKPGCCIECGKQLEYNNNRYERPICYKCIPSKA